MAHNNRRLTRSMAQFSSTRANVTRQLTDLGNLGDEVFQGISARLDAQESNILNPISQQALSNEMQYWHTLSLEPIMWGINNDQYHPRLEIRSIGDIQCMLSEDVNVFLTGYSLDTTGDLFERRKRLARAVGIPQYHIQQSFHREPCRRNTSDAPVQH